MHHDGRTARSTIERLSRAGVDGGAIELLGRSEVVTAGRYGDRQTDLGSSLAIGGRILRGVAWGVLPGAVFGALLLAFATTPSLTSIGAGALGGAGFGASLGALTSLLAVPTMASSWERTFSPMVPGGVVIGVRIDDDRGLQKAKRVLRLCGAHTVREVVDLADLPELPIPPDLPPDLPIDPRS